MSAHRPLRRFLEITRDIWDEDGFRLDAREAFARAVACGTDALGAEVFASASEERVVPHTCKSRACPSCGHKATLAWQRDLWCDLPEVPYLHVCLTMPDVLWPIFQRNRHLLRDLPALGAQVLQRVTRQRHGIERLIVVFPHTFGRHLNFNCHLHVLVSAGGLEDSGARWIHEAGLHRVATMRMWRYAVVAYLRRALDAGLLKDDRQDLEVMATLDLQYARRWIVHVSRFQTKAHVLRYAGRYARKPPIAQHRFRQADRAAVRFQTKDTRTKQLVETSYEPARFLALLADHLPDKRRHNVRYFGLLAPRTKHNHRSAVFASLGQRPRPKPGRLPWAESVEKSFGANPLRDARGGRLVWVRRLPPSTLA